MKRLALFVLLAVSLAAAPSVAAVYDLANDWSDTQNPMGAWSLYKSPTALFTINQSDYDQNGTNVHAWADQPFALNAHVPMWSHDADLDYVGLHGAELDRTGSMETSAVWTSPEDGTATISGSIWNVWVSGRVMAWELRKNGAVLSTGTLNGNGVYTAETPFDLASGSGGASVLTQSVAAGDRIQLAFISMSESGNLGDSLCAKFSINEVPEPSVLLGLVGGVGCLVPALRRRRR